MKIIPCSWPSLALCCGTALLATPDASASDPPTSHDARIVRGIARSQVNPIAITLLAAGGAALVSGALLGAFVVLPGQGAIQAACSGGVCVGALPPRQLFEQTQTSTIVSGLLLANGVFYVAGGLAWAIAGRGREEPRAPAVVVVPSYGQRGFGVVVEGRF